MGKGPGGWKWEGRKLGKSEKRSQISLWGKGEMTPNIKIAGLF